MTRNAKNGVLSGVELECNSATNEDFKMNSFDVDLGSKPVSHCILC